MDYRKMIIPLATVITPNKKESKILSGCNKVEDAAKRLQELGARNVIITGFRESDRVIEDFVMESGIEKYHILKMYHDLWRARSPQPGGVRNFPWAF